MYRRIVVDSRMLLSIALLVALSGCCKILRCPKICPSSVTPPRTATPTPTPTPPACTTPTIDTDRSLVVHDPVALASPFAFRRTLQKIIDTSGNPATTPEALLQTMLDSFAGSSFVQPLSGKTIPVDPRPLEAGLSASQLLDPTSPIGMVPVGLFNRLDLAPDDGVHCGEYRIVYAMQQQTTGRFFIIFESKLPNPTPASGLAGCQPVAKFWADLSTNPNLASRIAALETFYYQGLPTSPFGPVVAHANYGVPFGQVRTNLFVGFTEWQLREHRTSLQAGVPVFKVDADKDTPLVELYRPASSLPPGFSASDQQAFRAHFLNGPICNLMRPDRVNATVTRFDLVNGIGAGFDPAANEFQSVSQGDEDDPAAVSPAPDPAFVSQATARLASLSVTTAGSTELLNRAGAMTCGGCHQFSNDAPLTNGTTPLLWPQSAGFVHITEGGALSQTLTSFFLPRRNQILARFVCDPTAEAKPSPSCPPLATVAAPLASHRHAPAAVGTLPSKAGLDPSLEATLRKGRQAAIFKEVDDARMAVLGTVRRATKAKQAERAAAFTDAKRAEAVLAQAVERARAEEQSLPGAFVSIRRTH